MQKILLFALLNLPVCVMAMLQTTHEQTVSEARIVINAVGGEVVIPTMLVQYLIEYNVIEPQSSELLRTNLTLGEFRLLLPCFEILSNPKYRTNGTKTMHLTAYLTKLKAYQLKLCLSGEENAKIPLLKQALEMALTSTHMNFTHEYNDNDEIELKLLDDSVKVFIRHLAQMRAARNLIETFGPKGSFTEVACSKNLWESICEMIDAAICVEKNDVSTKKSKELVTVAKATLEKINLLDSQAFVEMLKTVHFLEIDFLYIWMMNNYPITQLSLEHCLSLPADVKNAMLRIFAIRACGLLSAAPHKQFDGELGSCAAVYFGLPETALENKVAIGSLGQVMLVDRATKQIRKVGSREGFTYHFAYHSGLLVSAGALSKIRIWNPLKNDVIECTSDTEQITALSIDNDTIYAAAHAGIRMWDLKTGKEIAYCKCESAPTALCVYEDVIIAGFQAGTVTVWDKALREKLVLHGHVGKGKIKALCMSSGRIVTTSGVTVCVWDPQTGSLERSWKYEDEERTIEKLYSYKGMIIACCDQKTVLVFDPATGLLLAKAEGDHDVIKSLSAHDDSVMWACMNGPVIWQWDISLLSKLQYLCEEKPESLMREILLIAKEQEQGIIIESAKLWKRIAEI